MEEFELYEDAVYKIDKSIDMIDNDRTQESIEKVVNAYDIVRETSLTEGSNIRAYVESIIGAIKSTRHEDAMKYATEMRNRIDRYQKDMLASPRTV